MEPEMEKTPQEMQIPPNSMVERTWSIWIYWPDKELSPRVFPPIAEVQPPWVKFENQTGSEATVRLPDVLGAAEQVIPAGARGEFPIRYDKELQSAPGTMHPYSVVVANRPAVGCSPPGMVLGDPTKGG
ncbi:MAG: hypothetical protein IH621_04240 [Krumholzibacteria bacterium]|nr:hypothetical protein [Candidatus Krumholzibacteria bacterium]